VLQYRFGEATVNQEKNMLSLPSRLLSASIVAALAGCSGAGGPLTFASNQQTQAVLHVANSNGGGRIYSSSYGNSTVSYYDKGTGPNNPVAGMLTGTFEAPEGMAVDDSGNLYVANGDAQNVLVYAPGASSPTTTLSDPNGFPVDVAVDSDGTIYAANIWGMAGNPGTIAVYKNGATSPTSVLNDRAFTQVAGAALDRHGNLFVSYDANHGSVGAVVEFQHGKKMVQTKISLGAAGGIGFDAAGHLLAMDCAASTLNVYDAGNAKPIHKLKLPGSPIYFAFGKQSKMLYVANYANGEIDVYDYTPSKLTLSNTITNGMNASSDNLGVAISPQ
jgi:sugar lactone lactonase YvrE